MLFSDGKIEAINDEVIDKIKSYGAKIISVGCGQSAKENSDEMKRIAKATGGFYIYANSKIENESKDVFIDEIVLNLSIDMELNKDTDGDGMSDKVEEDGMRDQWGNYIVTDPAKADTDGDGISDDVEMGDYVQETSKDPAHFKRVSDPRVYTVKSDLTSLYVSANNLASEMDRTIYSDKNQVLLVAYLSEYYFDISTTQDGRETEYIYSPAENLNIEVSFTNSDNYQLENLSTKQIANDRYRKQYMLSALVSYKKTPAKKDEIIWRVTADNLKHEGTEDYIEDRQKILSESDVSSDHNLVKKVEARLAELEKNFVEKFCEYAQQGSSNADKDEELAQRMAKLSSKIQSHGGDVPDEVCEAFGLAVLEAWDNGGSKAEKYKNDPEELYQQLLKHIESSVRNVDKEVIVDGDTYRLKITLMHSQGAGVDFAFVDKNGRSYATLMFTTSFDELKEVLASYCAKLAELIVTTL